MLVSIRRLGNSRGILIPKPVLKQMGLSDQVEMHVDGNTLILRNSLSNCSTPCGKSGLILLDQIRTVDKTRLVKRSGALSPGVLKETLNTLGEIFAE